MNSGEQLCLACGLCCDGTLYDGVQLEPGEDVRRLQTLGLTVSVSRARQPVARFPQPCAALCADRTCRLYANRPRQCRTFECGVFKQAKAGEIEFAAALRLVTKARRLADRVRRLLGRLGDTEEHRSLGERVHRMQCRLEAAPGDQAALAVFADISLAEHHLKLITQTHFYTRQDEQRGKTGDRSR